MQQDIIDIMAGRAAGVRTYDHRTTSYRIESQVITTAKAKGGRQRWIPIDNETLKYSPITFYIR